MRLNSTITGVTSYGRHVILWNLYFIGSIVVALGRGSMAVDTVDDVKNLQEYFWTQKVYVHGTDTHDLFKPYVRTCVAIVPF